jgi:hypothetical protein
MPTAYSQMACANFEATGTSSTSRPTLASRSRCAKTHALNMKEPARQITRQLDARRYGAPYWPDVCFRQLIMRIEEVPAREWAETLNEFTIAHEGWLVSMATFASDEEPRTDIRNLPLIGVSADRADHGDIAISVARSSSENVTRVIERAARVYLQRGNNGSTASLIVDSEEGIRTVLSVRARAEAKRSAAGPS